MVEQSNAKGQPWRPVLANCGCDGPRRKCRRDWTQDSSDAPTQTAAVDGASDARKEVICNRNHARARSKEEKKGRSTVAVEHAPMGDDRTLEHQVAAAPSTRTPTAWRAAVAPPAANGASRKSASQTRMYAKESQPASVVPPKHSSVASACAYTPRNLRRSMLLRGAAFQNSLFCFSASLCNSHVRYVYKSESRRSCL